MRLTPKGFHTALGLIERVDRIGGVRDWIALAVQVDGWVGFDRPIPLGGGVDFAEPGFPLGADPASGRALWLLEGARLFVGPPVAVAPGKVAEGSAVWDQGHPPTIYDLAETPLPRDVVAHALRRALLAAYVDGLALAEHRGPALQAGVAELLTLSGEVDARSRAVLLGALAEALGAARAAGRAGDWAPLVPRLRVGFERGLADRDPEALAVAAGALVRLAVAGPLPTGEPRAGARILTTLFNFPRPEIQAAALAALAALDPAALASVADVVRPLADAALASVDAGVRRAASDVEVRLRGGGGEWLPAVPGGALDGDASARWLRALAMDPEGLVALLPRVVEAFDDADAGVRRAALAAVDPVLGGAVGDGRLRARVVEALLGSADATLVAAGLEAVDDPARPLDDAAAVAALWRALDGAVDRAVDEAVDRAVDEAGGAAVDGGWKAVRDDVSASDRRGLPELTRDIVARLAARYVERPAEGAADGFEALLRHRGAAVRAAALDAVAGLGRGAVRLRDLLTHALTERLRDGVPEVRAAAGRAVLALGLPGAETIVAQAVVDPDARVREGLVAALRDHGAADAVREAERLARAVDAVCRGASAVDGDARLRWTAALGEVVARPGPRTVSLLLAVLATIPAGAVEPFLQFAILEIDRHLVRLAVDGTGGEHLVAMCRRLLDGATPQPAHAARLAGERVTEDAEVFEFLWTMATAGRPGHAAAARKALARLTQAPKSPAVMRAIAAAYSATDDPAQRDVLRGWYGGVPRR